MAEVDYCVSSIDNHNMSCYFPLISYEVETIKTLKPAWGNVAWFWIFKNDINKLQKDVVIFTTNTSIILEGQDQPGMVINAGETYWHNTCLSGRSPIFQKPVSQLRKHIQTSITTSKWSEWSIYVRRGMVLKL